MALLYTTGILTWEPPQAETDIIKGYRLFWAEKTMPTYSSRYYDHIPSNPTANPQEIFFPFPGMTSVSTKIRVGVATIDDDDNLSDIVEIDIPDDLLRGRDLIVPDKVQYLDFEFV